MKNAAITVTLRKFRDEYTQKRFTGECHDFIENTCGFPVGNLNDRSWDDCYNFLSKYLPTEDQYQDFHQPMKNFKRWAGDPNLPMNDIIAFDEAQRAWDPDRLEPGQTEATLLLRIGGYYGE